MSFLTLRTLATRTSLLRPSPYLLLRPTPPTNHHFSTSPRASATQDYGSGAGSPEGENPQAQGKNPMEHMEHPGPPAPDVGHGDKSNKPSSGGKGDGSGAGKGLQEGQKQGGESESVKKHNEHFEKKEAKGKGESL